MSAMFYLSRGGAPEGPFEEARLLHMIQSGELTDGGVCPVGQNEWIALNAVPMFAQALAARAAPPPAQQPMTQPGYGPAPGAAAEPGYGAPPAQAGYGPAPTEPGYGPGPTQPDRAAGPTQPDYAPKPGYGAQPGYGAPAQQYGQPAPEAKKGVNKALLFGGIAAALLLLLVGGAIAAYAMFFSSGGAQRISEAVPQDCEFFVEVPSMHQLVSDLHDVQFLDTSLRDDKQVFDSSADSISKAFDISKSDAVALLASAETFGISGRKLATSPEVVIALGMKNATTVETLLKSTRFVAAGSVGQTGKRYQLTRKPAQPGQDALLKGLSEAEVSATDKHVLVWFPKANLLAVGDLPLVTDLASVLEAGAASIQKNPAFQAAQKDFDGKARLTAFVDPNLFSTITDPKVRDLIDSYFKPAGPITGSLQVKPAGFLSSFTGRITGSKLPRGTAYEGPQALDLPGRLPEETFAYVAASTKSKLTGAELEKLLLDQVGSADPNARAQAQLGLTQMETLLGVSVSRLIDSVGGQTALGVSATSATSFAGLSANPQSLAQFNLTWLLELKDPAEFQKLAAGLRTKILPTVREVAVTPDGAGFSLAPRGLPVPVTLRVKFLGKYLFVSAGLSTLCDRAEAAFSKGEHTLKDEPGHKSALAALPEKAHFRMWVDTGRIGDTLMQNPLMRAQLLESGVSLDKIHMTGPDRVTSALAVQGEVTDEVWTYKMDALNFQALAPLSVAGSTLGSGTHRLPFPL
ncbi:MAG: hypothetical protein ABI488_11945 [Polyangiaceae bacterium]